MRSWKTTSAGILIIAGGIINFVFDAVDKKLTRENVSADVMAIVTGVGLAFAKDFNKTGKPGKQNIK